MDWREDLTFSAPALNFDLRKEEVSSQFVICKHCLLVDDHLLQLPLGGGSLHNLLVNGVCCDESVDHDWLGLANPVTSVLGLQVLLRIPI